jgi:hypothetical protein
MKIPVDRHLHRTPEERLAHFNTHAGQAGFAGEGPAGMTCALCRYWRRYKVTSNGPCQRYRELTGREGPRVPSTADACKYSVFIIPALRDDPRAALGSSPPNGLLPDTPRDNKRIVP